MRIAPRSLVRAGLVVRAALVVLVSLAAPACKRLSNDGSVGADESAHHHELNPPPVGPSVTVTLDGRSESVELASVAPDAGAHSVPLVAVFESVWPLEDLSQLHFDLMGADGFRPMSRPKCTHLLSGDEAAHVRLDIPTHDVSIEGLDLPGCYRVRGVVTIDVAR